MNSSVGISFTDPAVQKCPFAAYREVRELGPVYKDPANGWYIVTDYDLVRKIAGDTHTFSSETGLLMVRKSRIQETIDTIWRENGYLPVNTLVVSDPPEHTFYRSLVDKAFTPLRVRQMESYLESIVDSMIDKFIDNPEVEFHNEMAVMVPIHVIADQLGVPRSDIDKFKLWSDANIAHCDQSYDDEEEIRLTKILCELQQYIAQKAQEYIAAPRDCMLSDLANADVNGRKLSMQELVAIVTQILTAGQETTANTMSAGMLRMIQQPGLEEKLRANPEQIPNFIEEVLRLDAPVQGLFRRATCDTEIGGVSIPAESLVVVKWGAANRDPKHFPEPDELNLNRPNARRHTTFGYGAHICIGNQLARGELRIAFSRLLQRLKNYRLSRGDASVVRPAHYFAYGVTELHLGFDRV